MKQLKISLLLGFCIFTSSVIFGQTPDLIVKNNTGCTIKVWAILYEQDNNNPCTPNCDFPIWDPGPVNIAATNTYTFIWTQGPPDGAWGTVIMEGSAGYDDDLQYCGASTRGNETCTTPIEKNIYLDYISCTSSLFTVEIND